MTSATPADLRLAAQVARTLGDRRAVIFRRIERELARDDALEARLAAALDERPQKQETAP